jgi:hypothetical protein
MVVVSLATQPQRPNALTSAFANKNAPRYPSCNAVQFSAVQFAPIFSRRRASLVRNAG